MTTERARPSSVLNTLEVDWTIEFFLYYMDMETRHKLMINLPQVYDKLMGKKIMGVDVPNPEPVPDPVPSVPQNPLPIRTIYDVTGSLLSHILNGTLHEPKIEGITLSSTDITDDYKFNIGEDRYSVVVNRNMRVVERFVWDYHSLRWQPLAAL